MDKERGRQPPLPPFDTELSINLRTGRTRLGHRRATGEYSEERRKRAMILWQTDLPGTLALAVGSWQAVRAVQQAEEFGINVEYTSRQMPAAKAEAALVAKFRQARGLHLTAVDVILRLHREVAAMRERLGEQANWLPAFFDYTIDKLSETYSLSQRKTADLKRLALQRHLPGLPHLL